MNETVTAFVAKRRTAHNTPPFDECYHTAFTTALHRLMCCSELGPFVQQVFRVWYSWCPDDPQEVVKFLCRLVESFTHPEPVLMAYDFIYQHKICVSCPYNGHVPHRGLARAKRLFSVVNTLNLIEAIVGHDGVPLAPTGPDVLVRDYVVVLGELVKCLTRDIRGESWF